MASGLAIGLVVLLLVSAVIAAIVMVKKGEKKKDKPKDDEPKDEPKDEPPAEETPPENTPEVPSAPIVTGPDTCTGQANANESAGCLTGSDVGFQVHWLDQTPEGLACKKAVDYWLVDAWSSWDTSFVLQTRVPGTDTTFGFSTPFPPFINGKKISFSAMPYDKDNKPLLKTPIRKDIDQKSDMSTCTSVGTNITSPMKWNNNKNLVRVRAKNNGGGDQQHSQVTDAKGKQVSDSGWKYNTTYDQYVPKGGAWNMQCQTKISGQTQWIVFPWDDKTIYGNGANHQYKLTDPALQKDMKLFTGGKCYMGSVYPRAVWPDESE
jgi:hypothetical protein